MKVCESETGLMALVHDLQDLFSLGCVDVLANMIFCVYESKFVNLCTYVLEILRLCK